MEQVKKIVTKAARIYGRGFSARRVMTPSLCKERALPPEPERQRVTHRNLQKMYFNPSWMIRGGWAEKTCPNVPPFALGSKFESGYGPLFG